MKIDILDGAVSFESGLVGPGETRTAFLATELGRSARQELVNVEWWHMHVRPEPGIAADVLFRGDGLDRVFIVMEIPADAHGEWTEKNELARKALHDDWLRREIGRPPYEYPWGWIESFYDAKSCVSEIIVKYGG